MQIAVRLIQKLQTALSDLRYGGILKGSIASKYRHMGARGTENTRYHLLAILFKNQIRPSDVLVDIGCGKGRVLNWWLDYHRNHAIYGIELDPSIAEQARQRLRSFKNVTILTGDACVLLPDEGSLLYLFNPFDGSVMQRLIEAVVRKPMAANGLPRRIVYHNSVHLDLFEKDDRFSIRRIALPESHDSAIIEWTVIGQQTAARV